jgi:ferrous iron transport protein B
LSNVSTGSRRVALVGNPNCGKSTLFNILTGLNQRTGNFPGVTVDKHTGSFRIKSSDETLKIELIDLPGTYSIFPKSMDEEVTCDVLLNAQHPDFPHQVMVVADATNMKRCLGLCTQIIDLGLPAILVVNMIDLARRRNIEIDLIRMAEWLGIPVVAVDSLNEKGYDDLRNVLFQKPLASEKRFFTKESYYEQALIEFKTTQNCHEDYACFVKLTHQLQKNQQANEAKESSLNSVRMQTSDAVARFRKVDELIKLAVKRNKPEQEKDSFSSRLDYWLTHKVWGFVIFLMVLFVVFQSIFNLAELPMTLIENLFAGISERIQDWLPPGMLNDLLVNGVLAGLSGVLIFIPQIAFLFAFIALLEDSGYMARVSFIMDRLMRRFGINGKSIIPLISGVACAVPSIMSTRTISNWKERTITLLVTPLMSCSARLPVYTLLISLVIPDKMIAGILNLQGLVLLMLYLIGFIAALGTALILKYILKSRERSFFIMELPVYRLPRLKHVLLVILDKVKIFVVDAGKVIMAIAIVLWFLSSYGQGESYEQQKQLLETSLAQGEFTDEEVEQMLSKEKLEHSYAGRFGKLIEPAIEPLGYDWKIGISLITSFAAREVFVGTMSTLYSAGNNDDDITTVREKMRRAVNDKTGQPVYTMASGISLMLFYAFALQCMSTLAVVYRETRSWRWPLIQFLYMGALAYLASYLAYHILS